MDINDLTVEQLKEVSRLCGQIKTENEWDLNPGDTVFIRTVTHHHVGRVVKVKGKVVTLKDASWVASDGRFHEALKTGVLDEVEPFPEAVRLNTDSFIDCTDWPYDLPKTVK